MNAADLPRHASSFSQAAGAFGAIHCAADTQPFIANVRTSAELLAVDDWLMPATVNHGEPDNAWVCSPLAMYRDYAIAELYRYFHPVAARPLSLLCRASGYAMRMARIDHAVALNNWMLSTNIYPGFEPASLRKLVDAALARWPGHSLWFRSLNEVQHGDWLAALSALGFDLIAGRQVYLFDRDELAPRTTRHGTLRHDLKLLDRTALQRVGNTQLGTADYERVAQLYEQLYINKYTRLNPRYSPDFIQAWHRAGLLELTGFRGVGGELQGVVGMFRLAGTITAPIVGYNTALPQKMGLYRLLMATVFETVLQSGETCNLSAGAAHFKRLRGGRPAIEYSAVMSKHLPADRRRVIGALRTLTTSVGVPIMKRFKL